jgi:hypothetical protein
MINTFQLKFLSGILVWSLPAPFFDGSRTSKMNWQVESIANPESGKVQSYFSPQAKLQGTEAPGSKMGKCDLIHESEKLMPKR